MLKKGTIRQLWCRIKTYKRGVFVIFEVLWLLFLWDIEPFVTAGVALLIPPIAAFVISLVMAPRVTLIYLVLDEKGWVEKKAVGLILYGTSYLLTLYLTIMLLQTVVEAFHIDTIEFVQFALQTVAFFLYIAFFCSFRNPKQMQYWAYAVAYGFFIVWEWAVDWNDADCTLLGINMKFARDFFIIPFKEAMLLFIILDTFFKAKDELKQEKRLCNEEEKIC